MIFDVDLTERFLDSKATPEEQERLARAFAEYYPNASAVPEEIQNRVEYIAGELSLETIMVWFKRYPGLPRFIAVVFDLLELLGAFEEDDWIVDNLRTLNVPEQLRGDWLKNSERAGLAMLNVHLNGAVSHRRFPYAGWLAEEILQLLIRACDGPRGSKRRRNGFRETLAEALAALRENAAQAGVTFSGDLPEDW
ncbi:MAG: hypothetical protein QG608_1363 [Actinomycetota bacterium]|nr:hypothetical protein [Actinomycetota bacterium]